MGLDTSWLKISPFPRRYNAKPTQEALILAKTTLEPLLARWWPVPSWFRGDDVKGWTATTLNARIEEAKDKPTFRAVWGFGRCLIPATGYSEWTGDMGDKQPHFISPAVNDETLFPISSGYSCACSKKPSWLPVPVTQRLRFASKCLPSPICSPRLKTM